MNLDLVNNLINDVKNNKVVHDFIKELQNYLENNILQSTNTNNEKEKTLLDNITNNKNIITVKYRDEMYIKRAHILNDYAKKTLNKGTMYYVYGKNTKMLDVYNLCICQKGMSNIVLEKSIDDLPNGVQIGSVLRIVNNKFALDEEATKDIYQKVHKMQDEIFNEQTNFLESKRIEGHIYEMHENGGDRAWLYDITNGNVDGIEEVEEINFPEELLKNAKEGDLFIFENGKYQKYITK